MDDIDIIDAMMSPIVPMSRKEEVSQKDSEVSKVKKLESDTQILLAIFEKVVEIEDMLEKGSTQAPQSPDPVQLSVDAFSGVM